MMPLIRNEEATYLSELRKMRIIKTVYALLLIYRTYQILNCYFYYQRSLMIEEWIFSAIYSGLLLIMLFRNYWIIPLLIAILQPKFDNYFACNTVGSLITIYMTYYFAAFYFTLKKMTSSINKDYLLFNSQINNYKYLLAVLWGISNLYALENHMKDPYWTSGTSFEVMLCNPFLSPFFQTFRELYLSHSEWYFLICKISSCTFVAMQTLMLPFFLIKKTRFLYYLSFFIYLIGITIFIDTSFLAHFAWVLFFLLLPQISIIGRKIHVQKNPMQLSKTLPKFNKIFAWIILLFALYNTPILDKGFKKVVWLFREWDTYRYVDRKIRMIGLGKSNLFNAYQIECGSKWFVIYKKDREDWKLVPIMDTTGRKLSYNIDWLHTCNHGSDFLWLANTFCYAIGNERVDYSNSATPYKLKGAVYERLIRFDFNKYSKFPSASYKVCFYSNIKARKSANPFLSTKDSTILFTCSKNELIKAE